MTDARFEDEGIGVYVAGEGGDVLPVLALMDQFGGEFTNGELW